MERRHFEPIAEIVKYVPLTKAGDRAVLADFFAERLVRENARFDKARFLKACGVV
jgi:hypothetical protein